MSLTPTVLHPLTLSGLLHYILTTQSGTCPTLLLICSSRDSFLQDLACSLQQSDDESGAESLEHWTAPTLHNLFTTRHIKLAFCASVQTLLAYLTAYGRPGLVGNAERKGRLVLVNPLALHAPTPSFSAQGLSRTFATAVETSLKSGIVLHVVECEGRQERHEGDDEEDAVMANGHEENHAETEVQDPWEQEVSILNVSARRFGSGNGERAWAGRTVKAKSVVARWFRFHKLEERHRYQDQG